MRIVTATTRDLKLLVPLFEAYRAFYGCAAAPARSAAYLRQRLTRREAVVFLAVEGSGPGRTGLGFTLLYPTHSSLSMARAWVLNDLYVAPEGRRSGVARALMERGRRHAIRTAAAYLTLETADSNRKAQRLYESSGWTRERGFRHYLLALR
jgi:ribosomal protein S18 acetylase RimI-like enzyme